jgi:hypothetical protein
MATIYGGGKKVIENAKQQKSGKRSELSHTDTVKADGKGGKRMKPAVKKQSKQK